MSSTFIIEYSIDFLYVACQSDGKIVSKNYLFKQYTSHIQPKSIRDIFVDTEDIQEMVDTVVKAKALSPDPIRFYAKTKQKTKGEKWLLWNVYYILDSLHFMGTELGDVISITSHDYERQKKLLEDFRFMLSHEIRQPLTSIAGIVSIITKNTKDSEIDKISMLKMLDKSVDELDSSIKALVNMAAREI